MTITDEERRMLVEDLTRLSPTCRRGEGFADRLQVDAGRISGRAVPYGHTIELLPGLLEEFLPGTFARQLKQAHRAKLCLEHGQVVGKLDTLEERDDGLYFTGSVVDDPAIPEAVKARAMLTHDLADELSIGFQQVADGTRVERLDDGSVKYTHHRARLMEISLVPWGAYGREAVLARARLVDTQALWLERRRAEVRAWVDRYKREPV